MSNSTVNFTNLENSTTHTLGLMDYLEISVYSINLLFGCLTHSYVLWLIVTGSSGVVSEFLNLNLSVYELAICLNNLIFVLSIRIASLSEFAIFLVGFSFTGRPLFQCLMCVERYLAVVHPVTFLKYKPLRYRLICCAAAWIIILGSCTFCMYALNEVDRYSYSWFFSTQYLLFLFIQLFCLVAVLRALKQSGPGERKREEEGNRMKRRAFHLILLTTLSMAIIYGPYIITGFVTIVLKKIIDSLWFFAFTCCFLAGFVHPVLYLHSMRKLSFLCFNNF